jgi:hypothetical protein
MAAVNCDDEDASVRASNLQGVPVAICTQRAVQVPSLLAQSQFKHPKTPDITSVSTSEDGESFKAEGRSM